MDDQRVVVIGAGIGGIAAAAQLAGEGYKVTVVEKNDVPGGRCGRMQIQGHRFDTGPTLFLMPGVYREAFEALGERMEDHLNLIRVDPTYRIHFGDGCQLVLTSDLEAMGKQLEAIEPGSTQAYLRYLAEGCRHYNVALERVVGRDFKTAREFFTLQNLATLVTLKSLRKHYRHIGRYFRDEHLKFAFIFQNLYMGIHPYRAPAIFSLMQYTELGQGVWYPQGGMHGIIEALVKIAESRDVQFAYNAPVTDILASDSRATGVRLADGRELAAEMVIANADLPYVYQHLLPGAQATHRYAGKRHGCSALVFYWGLDRQYPQLEAHNLFMAPDIRGGFDRLFDDLRLSNEPSFYVHAPVRLDPSLAPEGQDTISVAVPVPHIDPQNPQDWEAMRNLCREYILKRLGKAGMGDLEDHMKFEVCFTPEDWGRRYNLTLGSAHGLSHELTQMGYFRPKIQHPRLRNLYFVGASTHPGTGLPSVLVSAGHVCARILGTPR